jgi:hypothetical protein
MKTFILTAFFTGMFILSAKGQAVYDFTKGKFTTIGHVQEGATASLRIDNINTLFYKVTIKGVKVSLSTPPPAELQALFRLPNPAEKASEAAEGTGEVEGATDKMKDETKKATGDLKVKMDTLVRRCSAFVAEARKIRLLKLRRYELTSLAKQSWPNHAALTSKLPSPLAVADMHNDIMNFSDTYYKAKTQYAIAIDAATDASAKERIKEALKEFEEGYQSVDEDNLTKLVADIDVLQIKLADSTNFSALAPPVQAEDCDFVEYNILIEPDQPDSRLIPAGTMPPIPVIIPVKGGWKPDFSVGPNFSFGAGAKDEKYYLTPTSKGSGTLTVGENANVVRPGIAAMLHAHPRSGKNYAAGFMVGVGAGFKAENTLTASYYFGGSLILGKGQKVILNTGVSFLSVDRLKVDYQVGNTYSIESTKISDITEKVLKPSFFFGISYNITNRIIVK